jgi:hypothetical protein
MDRLTRLVVEYQRTGQGYPRVFREVAVLVYEFPGFVSGLDEDDCGEFFLYFFPRIQKTIDCYTNTGGSFVTYLRTCMRWQINGYMTRQRSRKRVYSFVHADPFWESSTDTLQVRDRPVHHRGGYPCTTSGMIEFPEIKAGASGNITHQPVGRKQLLIAALKGCVHLTETHLRQVSDRTGYDYDWVVSCHHRLMLLLETRSRRIRALQEARNHAFLRVRILEDELALFPSFERRNKVIRLLKKERRRYARAHETIGKLPIAPTNREISRITGIPKGTVDSTLYKIRNRADLQIPESTSGVAPSAPDKYDTGYDIRYAHSSGNGKHPQNPGSPTDFSGVRNSDTGKDRCAI